MAAQVDATKVDASKIQNYTRGEVIEYESDVSKFFSNQPSNTVHVKVKSGSKLRNILGFTIKMFKEEENRHMLFAGCGDAIYKTITCVEIMKRKHKNLHQITKIGYSRIEEFWEPQVADLDRLKVTREIPVINILLCKDPLDSEEAGYQAPGHFDSLWAETASKYDKKKWKERRQKFQRRSHNGNVSEGHVAFFKQAKKPKGRKNKEEVVEGKTGDG